MTAGGLLELRAEGTYFPRIQSPQSAGKLATLDEVSHSCEGAEIQAQNAIISSAIIPSSAAAYHVCGEVNRIPTPFVVDTRQPSCFYGETFGRDM